MRMPRLSGSRAGGIQGGMEVSGRRCLRNCLGVMWGDGGVRVSAWKQLDTGTSPLAVRVTACRCRSDTLAAVAPLSLSVSRAAPCARASSSGGLLPDAVGAAGLHSLEPLPRLRAQCQAGRLQNLDVGPSASTEVGPRGGGGERTALARAVPATEGVGLWRE